MIYIYHFDIFKTIVTMIHAIQTKIFYPQINIGIKKIQKKKKISMQYWILKWIMRIQLFLVCLLINSFYKVYFIIDIFYKAYKIE